MSRTKKTNNVTVLLFVTGIVILIVVIPASLIKLLHTGDTNSVNSVNNAGMYTSYRYNFKVSYPTYATANETHTKGGIKVEISWPQYHFSDVNIRVDNNSRGLSLTDWLKANEPTGATGSSLVTSEADINFRGLPAKQLSIFGFDHTASWIVVERTGYIYVVSSEISNPNNPNFEEYQDFADEVIASITFTD